MYTGCFYDDMGSIPDIGLINKLHTWWNSKSRPAGLSGVARLVCERNSINPLRDSSREVGQPASVAEGLSPQTGRRGTTETIAAPTSETQLIFQFPAKEQELPSHKLNGTSLVPPSLTSSSDAPNTLIAHIPTDQPETVVDLEVRELLGFLLQQYQGEVYELNVNIPHLAVPLPSIGMKSPASSHLDFKVILSQSLATALMMYVRESRSAGGSIVLK